MVPLLQRRRLGERETGGRLIASPTVVLPIPPVIRHPKTQAYPVSLYLVSCILTSGTGGRLIVSPTEVNLPHRREPN
jgi:hypothetical protein